MSRTEKLRALFLAPDLSWLAERLRTRVRQGRALDGVVTLTDASTAQRSAIDNLVGRASTRGKTLGVSLPALADSLRAAELADDLHAVVAACYGHVPNERDISGAIASTWEAHFSNARAALTGDTDALEWLRSMEADGLVKRLAGGDPEFGGRLLGQACTIWRLLPSDGITLAELAGKATGDTHALDRGQPLSALLLRGLRPRSGHDGNGTTGALARRLAWEAVGVVIDRLSSPVLTFNLVPGTGVPVYLTYQQVQALTLFPTGDIYVVENPSVVESVASQLGPACRPIICTAGVPASAAKLLLTQLAHAGCRLHVRADFDWPGLRIADSLLRLPGAVPWRMDAATYRAVPATVPLGKQLFHAPWATDLAAAMAERGLAAYEEQLTATLIADLVEPLPRER